MIARARICPLVGAMLFSMAIACACAAQPSSEPVQEHRFALVIGVTGYRGFPEGERLNFADDDARLFSETIQRPECGGFPRENVILLTNEGATRTAIAQAVKTLQNRVDSNENNTVYVFFAGHGIADQQSGDAYLMPYDASRELVMDKGFRTSFLIDEICKRLQRGNLVFFIDACHALSGGIDLLDPTGGESGNMVNLMKNEINDIRSGRTTTMGFFSCQHDQVSYEDPKLGGGHGLFTWYLVQAINGAADTIGTADRDGRITADEMYDYVKRRVKAHTEAYPRQQLPDRVNLNADFELSTYDTTTTSHVHRETITTPDSVLSLARARMHEGDSAFRSGLLALAVDRYSAAVSIAPEFDSAHCRLGIALLEQGETAGSEKAFRRAIQLNGRNARAHLGLGMALLQHGLLTEARFELLSATTLDASNGDSFYYLAQAREKLGDPEGAALDLETYIARATDYNRVKAARVRLGILHRSIEYFREGRGLARNGAFDEAIETFYHVLRLDPYSSLAYYEIGLAFYQNEEFEEAVKNLAYSVRLNANSADTRFLLAYCYERIDDRSEAVVQYEEFLKLESSGRRAQISRERIRALARK